MLMICSPKAARRSAAVLIGGMLVPLLVAQQPDPVADPEAIVSDGHARFTILDHGLVRLEWSPERNFEDRASYFAVNRRFPAPKFYVDRANNQTQIRTRLLQIRYTDDGEPFNAGNLRVMLNVGDKWEIWEPGAPAPDNLGGTVRTLDGVSGATELEPGVLSRAGWSFIDDSLRPLLTNDDPPWANARANVAAHDWYLLVYGKDYPQALRWLTALGGQIPLPPRYAFGAWWSRYWAYSDTELRALVDEFAAHDVPLDVLVIDMDWHLDGWTGYTWNPTYFPDPDGFLKWLHARGLRVTLNLHPAEGVGRHEAGFACVCEKTGRDAATTKVIPFDCTDPDYMRAYFECLHHPLEAQGVDFWWLDWQQGEETKIAGLDPLPWLNHLHWRDQLRNPARGDVRPLNFSRWGGLGNQRYQIGFSGDTFCNWASLAFQPYFTATAGNVGFPYWSHDIGGHQPGPVEPELYTRWIQWGALSPILRTHTTKNPAAERRIWEFPAEYFDAMRSAWRLRYELLPYLYTSARTTLETSLPLCRPLYLLLPDAPEAYAYRDQYLLGDQLLVAPIVAPRGVATLCATARVWLPPGEWRHWHTGRRFSGPTELRLPTPLEQIPLFVRAGSVIPAAPEGVRAGAADFDPLRLHVFADQPGRFRFYEDDGVSRGHERFELAWTTLEVSPSAGAVQVVVDRVEGRFRGMASNRSYELVIHQTLPPTSVTVNGAPLTSQVQPDQAGWRYDAEQFAVIVRTPARPRVEQTVVRLQAPIAPNLAQLLRGGMRDAMAQVRAADGDAAGSAMLINFAKQLVHDVPAAESSAAAIPQAITEWAFALNPAAPRSAEFLARIFGLTGEFRFAPGGATPLTFETTFAPPLADVRGVEAQVRIAADEVVLGGGAVPPGVISSHPLDCREFLTADADVVPQARRVNAVLKLAVADGAARELDFGTTLLPSINGWWVAGPFEKSRAVALDQEMAALARVDHAQTWAEGKDGRPARWRRVVREVTPESDLRAEFFVNFREVFGWRPSEACAYAVAYLDAEDAREVRFALGSDDGPTVWLNGDEIFKLEAGRAYTPRQNEVTGRLKAGRNILVVRVDQGGGDWGFAVHVEDPQTGWPIKTVRTSLE